MKQRGGAHPLSVSAIHPRDKSLPSFIKIELQKQNKSITANDYNKHNYKDMVWKCTHLTVKQRTQLIELFSDYAGQFDGSLRKIL
eukprot:1356507-Ditylum_brightwellii.AAC.1